MEKAVPIDPAPKINIFAINYSLKINLLIKNKIAMISILPKSIKHINDILLKLFKSKKITPSKPYNEEFSVFVKVRIDSLNEVSKDKLSNVNIEDKINRDKIKDIKTKKAILTS